MPLKVLRATPSAAPLSVQIEDKAFGSIPNNIGPILFPGPFPPNLPPRHAHLTAELQSDPSCRWAKVVDTDLDDEMVAFSMWYFWKEGKTQSVPPMTEGMNREACERMFGGMREERERMFQGKPFVYLKLLHTHPAHQRRGAGGMLLQWGVDEADRLGLPAYLEATKEGKPLYEKYGFKEVGVINTDFSPWGGPSAHPSFMMLREKKQA